MEKINVVLVALNEKFLKQALLALNRDAVYIVAILTEKSDNGFPEMGDTKFPNGSFATIPALLDQPEDLLWLICGFVDEPNNIYDAKEFLVSCGVPEDKIVNFELFAFLSGKWFGNLRHVEKYGADFFATGNDCMRVDLNLKSLPMHKSKGVNLSGVNQDLRQSFLTAKYVFEHVAPGTIKFVLIGLAPYSFRYENANDFAACTHNLQYMLALDAPAQNKNDRLLQTLINDDIKNFAAKVTAEQADTNFDEAKNLFDCALSVKSFVHRKNELKNLTKKFSPESVEKNFRILNNYIQLCIDNGAKPVGVIFPFAPAIRDNYDRELLTRFHLIIRQLVETTEFTCFDFFDFGLSYEGFCDMTHMNSYGSSVISVLLSLCLYEQKFFPFENFLDMNYEYFELLSYSTTKDEYNNLMSKVFAASVERLRRKDKIKVAFVTDNASTWCGDKLYNYFARDARFEPTIFLCLQKNKADVKAVVDDFRHGVRQFKSRGLNVVGISDPDAQVPTQDIIFFLRPYAFYYPDAFQVQNLKSTSLVIYIPYGFQITELDVYNLDIRHVAWKIFFETEFILRLNDQRCSTGMPRGIYSGYPKLDALLEGGNKLKFNWKMSRRKAKKIIWAPHWSINEGTYYATFQWNYRFMYEFAKAHPEISWVVKPHPHLLHSAVDEGIFPSTEAFEEYLQAWNDLPNAQVYTGAYYHAIFATSDGMILDSSSFVSEYQYTHKPLIFLTRKGEQFNAFGNELLSHMYLVDGRDLKGITALMQKIFVDGRDPKRAERKEFFDKYLNYYKHNGMSASEFIYRNICDELKG